MKRYRYCILSIAVILAFFFVPLVNAQSTDPDIVAAIDYQFGSHISFSASLESTDQIARAVVFLRPDHSGETLVLEAAVTTQSDSHQLIAILDVRSRPIQPFEQLTYWWQLEFTSGTITSSPTQEFRYEDNRFQWNELSEDQIFLHWAQGWDAHGTDIIRLAQESLGILRTSLGLTGPEEVSIFLYPSVADLQSGLRIGGAPWIGAHTVPELGVVLLAAPSGPETIIAIERDLPHELTHLLLYNKMGEGYVRLPAWLNEGLATLQEKQANPAYRFELEQAIETDALLTLESLCSAFPISESDALLAYAQSASFTQYLLDVYGMGGILQLFDAFQEGTSCTGGVQRVYQRSLAQLESEWKTVHLQSPTSMQKLIPILPWGLLMLLIVTLVLIGLLARNQRTPPG
jgi:hypothetical protein